MPYKNPEKRRKFQRTWLNKRRDAWIAEHGPCVDCRSWRNLQLSYIDPTQKISHRIWSWSEVRRNAELAKCQVLCRSCKQLKTAEENAARKHGSEEKASTGCRCGACSWFRAKTANPMLAHRPVTARQAA